MTSLADGAKDLAKEVIRVEPHLLNLYRKIIQTKITISKIRIHGDYHLGQVLHTGKDFYIIENVELDKYENELSKYISEEMYSSYLKLILTLEKKLIISFLLPYPANSLLFSLK